MNGALKAAGSHRRRKLQGALDNQPEPRLRLTDGLEVFDFQVEIGSVDLLICRARAAQ